MAANTAPPPVSIFIALPGVPCKESLLSSFGPKGNEKCFSFRLERFGA
jgi:hypothetical protein